MSRRVLASTDRPPQHPRTWTCPAARVLRQHGVCSALASPATSAPGHGDLQGSASQIDADLLTCCITRAKRWCKIKDDKELASQAPAYYSVRGAPGWRLAISSHKVQAEDGIQHVLLSLALHCPDGGSTSRMAPPNDNLSDLLLHWGTSSGPKASWKSPNPGWHTSPPVSYDAGGSAWQTPFEFEDSEQQERPTKGPFQVMILQLPVQGALKHAGAGVNFILKTSAGQWLQDQSTNQDFFYATSEAAAAHTSATPVDLPKAQERAQERAPSTPGSTPTEQKQSSQKKMSQAERNKAELPDITKGVPWNPNEGPRVSQNDNQQILPASERAPVQWYSAGIFGPVDEAAVKAFVENCRKQPHSSNVELLMQGLPSDAKDASPHKRSGSAVSKWMVDAIGAQEQQAERSLMHRYNTAQQLVEKAGQAEDAHDALTAVLMWLRLSAARHLTWNRNYNVKPREISAAQDHLNTSLAQLFEKQEHLRHVVARSMAAAGRGGSSDVGQRIRDEILAVQSRNACKGGMMEEWHQKLHNNTSPDDVVICQALIAMLEEGLDIRAYWRVLHASGITAQRLASFDRAIRNEPRFNQSQVPGLLTDLRAYLQTLQSVHSGADLASAAGSVLGFSQKSMKGKLVTVEAVPGAGSAQLRELLLAVLYQQHRLGTELPSSCDAVSEAALMLQLVLAARYHLRPLIQQGNAGTGGRLRDVLFLDMSLDSTARTALETAMGHVKAEANAWLRAAGAGAPAGAPAGLVGAARVVSLAVENAAVSSDQLRQHELSEDLCKALKWLNNLSKQAETAEARDWALLLVSVVDRLKRSLSEHGHEVVTWLQPTALALGQHLAVPKAASCLVCEDAARGTSIAPVAQLLAAVEPSIRKLGGQGDWQIISPGKGVMQGKVRVEASLSSVQYETCTEPTVLLVDHACGQEEVPAGVVAVLTSGDCPDVLSHSAVRARNMGVLMAACLTTEGWNLLKQLADSNVSVSLLGSEVKVQKMA